MEHALHLGRLGRARQGWWWCGARVGRGEGKAEQATYRSLLLVVFSRYRSTGRTGSSRRDGRRGRRRRSRVSWSAWYLSGRDWQTRGAPRDCAVEDPCCVLFVCWVRGMRGGTRLSQGVGRCRWMDLGRGRCFQERRLRSHDDELSVGVGVGGVVSSRRRCWY